MTARTRRPWKTHLNGLAFLLVVASSGALAAPPSPEQETQDERTIRLLGGVLQDLPAQLASLKPEIRRVVFYSFQFDHRAITSDLAKTLQSMIETALVRQPQLQLLNLPEVKPMRVMVTEEGVTVGKGLKTLDDMRKLSNEQRLDGIVDAVLNITEKNLYLDLRITNLQTAAVDWSHHFYTRELNPIPKGYATIVDINIGLHWFQTQEIVKASSNAPVVLGLTPYYTAELRFTEAAFPGRQIDFLLKGGLLILADGTSFVGGGYVKTGIRTGLIRKELFDVEGMLERSHWLSVEADFGRIFTTGEPGLFTGGVHLDIDLSRHFSFGGGLSFVTTMDIKSGGSTIRVGGLSFDVVALRFFF